jgi:hypothetical protein
MPHKKDSEGRTHEITHTRNEDRRLQILSDADRIATFTHEIQRVFLQEVERIGRFDEYCKIAAQHLDLAREAKAYADRSIPVIRKLLIDLPFPKVVLQVEAFIDKSRPVIRLAIDMLMSNADEHGHFRYGDKALGAAALSSDLAHNKLTGILREHGPQRGIASESSMVLPSVMPRDKRVAQDKDLPKKGRKKAVTGLADNLRRNLQKFAAGNAFITLHDIDELMATLADSKHFFREELDAWKGISKTVETMRSEGRSTEDIREILLSHNMAERFAAFNEKILQLEVALRIAALRMEFVNQPVNEVLTAEYDIGTIQKLLRRQINESKSKEAGRFRKVIDRILGKKPGSKISPKEHEIFTRVLADALNNVPKRKF